MPPVGRIGGYRDGVHRPLVGVLIVAPDPGVELQSDRLDFILRFQRVV